MYITPTGNNVASGRPANPMIPAGDGEPRVPSFPSGARRGRRQWRRRGERGWHWPNFARTPSHAGLSQQLSEPLHTRTHCTHDWRWSSRLRGGRAPGSRSLGGATGCAPPGAMWARGRNEHLGWVICRWWGGFAMEELDRTCAYVYARGDDIVTAKISAGKSAQPKRRGGKGSLCRKDWIDFDIVRWQEIDRRNACLSLRWKSLLLNSIVRG